MASPRADTLVVDLDGTLLQTDLLHESTFGLLRQNPFALFRLPVWLLQGKAFLKAAIASRVPLDPSLLPWNEEFLAYLRQRHAAGDRLVLATASNERYAQAIADHLGIFSAVLASSNTVNMAGSEKLRHIHDLLGGQPFVYAGNGAADLPVWQGAAAAVLVNTPPRVASLAEAVGNVSRVFAARQDRLSKLLVAMRPYQWLKNLLVFVPLVLSHQLNNVTLVVNSTLGFVAFCLCASSVYLLNDLLDLAADRRHPTKRKRPFAAGELPVVTGVLGMGGLLLAALLIALLLPRYFVYVLIVYYLSTVAYSLWLKRAALVDGLVLAGLYTLRLIAGAAVIEVLPSFWLLAFSMFIFLSLAFIKRYSELLPNAGDDRRIAGRGYVPIDMETLAQLGSASGYLAVLVLALYINGEKVEQMYARPEALWILCPMMLYWVSRMWLLTRRGDMHEDPVVFTIRDLRTWWLAALSGAVLLVAIFWPELRAAVPWP
ncbi:MAG: UbiA family prenyltransferase [Gammaproteobacteria bacterium]|jgi:4-hydroxybenzoate polyprenyltransferase|nr:UbiA family prenyltransferase [Gammaproteobacteria bacterium]